MRNKKGIGKVRREKEEGRRKEERGRARERGMIR